LDIEGEGVTERSLEGFSQGDVTSVGANVIVLCICGITSQVEVYSILWGKKATAKLG